jgi:hypothetical protein
MRPWDFFLNKGVPAAVVPSPAFSLTKVMALLVPLVTALAGFLTQKVRETAFSSGEIAALMIALVAFLAFTGAADVLARAYAAAADSSLGVITLPRTAAGKREGVGGTVTVIAVRGSSSPSYLCLDQAGTLAWVPADTVELGAGG